MKANVIVVMGVAGSGKTTIGSLLAQRLGCAFADADDFHSPENKGKMASGVPLTDDDRLPWLQAIERYIAARIENSELAVVACSALKQSYRDILSSAAPERVAFAYLDADPELTQARLSARHAHFMKVNMLASQFATLEVPAANEAMIVDAAKRPEEIVDQILSELGNIDD